MKRGKKVALIVGGIVASLLLYVAVRFGPDTMAIVRAGFFEKTIKKEYSGTAEQNLRVIQTALAIFQDSEGSFPKGEKWMDSILNRLKTDNLEKGSEENKLRNPMVSTDQIYGFAMNEYCSEKYIGDLPDKGETILIFATLLPGRNVSGDPDKIGIKNSEGKLSLAITVDGKIIKH